MSAYWYKNGKLISTTGLHISEIIGNPEAFGLTKKYIEDTYKKYDERMGIEGKAREEIMIEAMKNGWIRIRINRTRSGNNWVIQFADFNKQKKDLKGLIEYFLLDKKEMKKYDIVHFLSYDGKTDEEYDDYYGKGIMTFLEALKKVEKVIVEEVRQYKYFDY